MGRYSDPLALLKAQEQRFRDNGMDMRAGHEDLAEQGLADMIELTGGTPSGKARIKLLRSLGHPFGRIGKGGAARGKKSQGALPFLPIGMVSGRLNRAMRKERVAATDAVQSFGVGPRGVPHARFILDDRGTRRMVGRGFQKEVKKRWKARNMAFVQHYVRGRKT